MLTYEEKVAIDTAARDECLERGDTGGALIIEGIMFREWENERRRLRLGNSGASANPPRSESGALVTG